MGKSPKAGRFPSRLRLRGTAGTRRLRRKESKAQASGPDAEDQTAETAEDAEAMKPRMDRPATINSTSLIGRMIFIEPPRDRGYADGVPSASSSRI